MAKTNDTISALRVKNLRCLTDTEFVDIRPLTVLVGRNSSGKSTFARIFPLLRQSIEQTTRGPLLWFGRLVDFGSFEDAITNNSTDHEIVFSFKVPINRALSKEAFLADPFEFNTNPIRESFIAEVTLYLTQDSDRKSTIAQRLDLNLFNSKCSIVFPSNENKGEVTINSDTWTATEDIAFVNDNESLIPTIRTVRRRRLREKEKDRVVWLPFDRFRGELQEVVTKMVHGNTSEEKKAQLIRHFPVSSDQALLQYLRDIPSAPHSWRTSLKNITCRSKKFQYLRNLILAYRLPQILKTIDLSLNSFFMGTRYLEPLRAAAQRYYRRQELAVDELDSKGSNLAMYLDSMGESEKRRFDSWTDEHFGFSVAAVSHGGHVALELRDRKSNTGVNLADMGFGFSQVLPLAVQLWSSIRRHRNVRIQNRRRGVQCVVIEQPELHLHPAYQARLADVIVATLNEAEAQGQKLSLIIETHSPSIIDRIGELIADNVLDKNVAQVLLFEGLGERGPIVVSQYDDDGVLQDWPYGFFEHPVC